MPSSIACRYCALIKASGRWKAGDCETSGEVRRNGPGLGEGDSRNSVTGPRPLILDDDNGNVV